MTIAGTLSGTGGAGGRSRRQWILGGIAVVLTALTIWDYSTPTGNPNSRRDRGDSSASAIATADTKGIPNVRSKREDPWQEAARLRHLLNSAKVIRQRYNTIAVPYAEAVASFAGLHPPGQAARTAAEHAIKSLVPEGVELKDVLIAEGTVPAPGVANFKATVSLASSDSRAITRAIQALGEAANGMIWTSFSLGVDGNNQRLLVKGELAIITVEQAE